MKGPFDNVSSRIETPRLCNYFFEILGAIRVAAVREHLSNELPEIGYRQAVEVYEFSYTVMSDSRRDAGLVVGNWDCDHRHGLGQ